MFLLTIDADSSFQNKIYSNNKITNFDYLNKFKLDISFTFFLRFDDQVRLEKIRANEVGWHPHFYNEKFQYYDDLRKVNDKLIEYMEKVPYKDCVRIGGCQGNEETFSILSEKFEIDSTIMAGCVRNDDLGKYNWKTYENRPYVKKMFHLPITTIYTKTFYDKKHKLRYLNPCYDKDFFREIVLTNYNELANLQYIMLSCHADEVCTEYKDDLLTCGYKNFYSNIEFISETFKYNFGTLNEYRNRWFSLQKSSTKN